MCVLGVLCIGKFLLKKKKILKFLLNLNLNFEIVIFYP